MSHIDHALLVHATHSMVFIVGRQMIMKDALASTLDFSSAIRQGLAWARALASPMTATFPPTLAIWAAMRVITRSRLV